MSNRTKKNPDPKAPVSYDVERTTLTLRDGTTIDFSCYGYDHEPGNLMEAAQWWRAMREGRPVPAIPRERIVRRELRKLMSEFSPARMEQLLAAAKEIEDEMWRDHYRAEVARGYTH